MEFLEYVVADAKLKGRTQSLTPSVYNTLLELYLQEGSRVKHMRQSFVVTGAGLSGGYRTAYVSSNFLAQTGYERDEVIDQEFTTFAVVRPPALRPHLHVVFLPCRRLLHTHVNGKPKWTLTVDSFVQEDDEGAMARMAFADAMREGRPVHRALSQQAKDGTVRPTTNASQGLPGRLENLLVQMCSGAVGVRLGDPAAGARRRRGGGRRGELRGRLLRDA